jgi:nicotinamide-nucleotide amidase
MPDSGLSPDLVAQAKAVITANRRLGRTVAVAESCTGGLVSAALTEIAGSSEVFEAGFITYGNAAKQSMLGVNAEVLETFGAVSIATAWAMAQGALKRSGCDVAVAITGVAGPGGGTEKKPVGTVVFARACKGEDPENVVADIRYFEHNSGRSDIRRQAALCALELLMPDASPLGTP